VCNCTQLGVRACCLGPRVSDFSVGLSVISHTCVLTNSDETLRQVPPVTLSLWGSFALRILQGGLTPKPPGNGIPATNNLPNVLFRRRQNLSL